MSLSILNKVDGEANHYPAPSTATGTRSQLHLGRLARELGVSTRQVQAAARLLDDGNTLPFIARYRKEATGSLDEGQLRSIVAKLAALDQLEERRSSVLGKLERLGVLSQELKAQVQQAKSTQEIEDLYLPHRPKRATKASSARDKGLGPLAETILRSGRANPGAPSVPPQEAARKFVRQPEVPSTADALAGAQDIIAEMAAELPAAREKARAELWQHGVLVSQLSQAAKQVQQAQQGGKGARRAKGEEKKRQGGEQPKGSSKAGAAASADAETYALYHDFSCPVKALRSHQLLALNRGEAQGVLSVGFQWRLEAVEALGQRLLAQQAGAGQQQMPAAYAELVASAIQSGLKRLLKPAMEREARGRLTETAGEEAVKIFSRNLHNLLLQPPMPGVVVLGVDPAFRTGCKMAVCDPTGKVLGTGVMYPHPPAGDAQREQAVALLPALVRKYGVQAVAIGNGTASRETQRFVADTLAAAGLSKHAGWCVVSEAGASVYSACELAAKELPGLDVSLRGAVSIARRLQDPLSELVKCPPEALGVGAYQHDMKAAALASQLAGVVESAVNAVGVDLNAASPALLVHVAGLTKGSASAIVAQRDAQGPFNSRQELLRIKGVGPRAFQQCAGFLRVRGGSELLDATAVHPESYAAAQALILEACGVGAGGSPAEAPTKRRKLSEKPASRNTGSASPASPRLTPTMLQQARPALQALLGQPAAPQGGPAGGPASAQLQQQQQGSASGRCGSGGGGGSDGGPHSGGRWVSGERLGEVAARLGIGQPTLLDILDSLLAPERDMRGQAGLASLQFKQALGVADLVPGMELSGIVRNVVDFGAFVDINAGQDGLIHISELRKAAQRAQQQQQGAQLDAFSLASVGDMLRVKVLTVDAKRGRINLAIV